MWSDTVLDLAVWRELETALADPNAWVRRDRIEREDPRPSDEIMSSYEALDRVVKRLRDHMGTQVASRPVAQLPPEPAPADAWASDRKPHQQAVAELLYEDMVWLFSVNDGEGALISLERLLILGAPLAEAQEFLEVNEEKLLKLYEDYMGPFSRVAQREEVDAHVEMPAAYLEQGPLGEILAMVDGQVSIADILATASCTVIQGCAAIKQLHRAQLIALE